MYTPAKLTLWTFPLDKRKIAIEIANYREQVYVVHDRRIFFTIFYFLASYFHTFIISLKSIPSSLFLDCDRMVALTLIFISQAYDNTGEY